MIHNITVVAEDRVGLLAELTALLAKNNINITDLNIQTVGADALIRLGTDRCEDCLRVLSEENYHVVSENLILLRVVDQPGALALIAKRLAEQKVDIRSMIVVRRHQGFAVMGVSCCDNDLARSLLHDLLIN